MSGAKGSGNADHHTGDNLSGNSKNAVHDGATPMQNTLVNRGVISKLQQLLVEKGPEFLLFTVLLGALLYAAITAFRVETKLDHLSESIAKIEARQSSANGMLLELGIKAGLSPTELKKLVAARNGVTLINFEQTMGHWMLGDPKLQQTIAAAIGRHINNNLDSPFSLMGSSTRLSASSNSLRDPSVHSDRHESALELWGEVLRLSLIDEPAQPTVAACSSLEWQTSAALATSIAVLDLQRGDRGNKSEQSSTRDYGPLLTCPIPALEETSRHQMMNAN